MRAYRQDLKKKRRKPRRLRDDELHGELVVIFEPEMSEQAVETLQFLVRKIKKDGLLTGRDRSDEYVSERVSGKLVV